MQDGNMRAAHQWNYIKYDGKGRPASQGIYLGDVNLTQAAMQTYVDGLDYSVNYYENPNATLINGGYYTNNIFPKVNNVTGSTALQPLTDAYYDTYDLDRNGSANFSYQAQGLSNEATPSSLVRGRLTVTSKTIVGPGLTSGTWLTSAVFYDSRGRAIQTQSRNHTNSAATLTDISTTVPDFTGKPLQTKVIKVLYGTTTTVVSTPAYDHHDRLLSVDQVNNGAAAIRVGAYTYNELGQMITKKLHSKNAGSTFMQSVDYHFNIRGQMLSINNSTLTAGSNNTAGTNALFGMEFLYNKVDAAPNSLNNTPYYNGMISAVKWMAKTTTLSERSYNYTYDDQNRLTGAGYADQAAGQGVWGNTGTYDENTITYDYNGNIVTLKRNAIVSGSTQAVDNLAYTYNGNKLNTVTDGTGANYTGFGYRNLTGSSTAYTYDANGNLLTDAYKATTSTYNVLNRVSKVTINTATGKYINYTYDASAVLIRKQQYDNNALVRTTDYVDGFTGENAALSYFPMPEGRIINSGGTLTPEYFTADQQGNVRVSFQEQGTTGVAVVKQENSYSPFGLVMPNSQITTPTLANKKLYNGGSEWQNDYGNLPDLYQTFYRSYDAALGRFTGIDPKAELTESLSPYHYAANNSVSFNDPMGDMVFENGRNVTHHAGEGQDSFRPYSGFDNWLNMNVKAMDGGGGGPGDQSDLEAAKAGDPAALARYAAANGATPYYPPGFDIYLDREGKIITMSPNSNLTDGKNRFYQSDRTTIEGRAAVSGNVRELTIQEANSLMNANQVSGNDIFLGLLGVSLDEMSKTRSSVGVYTQRVAFSYHANGWPGSQYVNTFKIGKGLDRLSTGLSIYATAKSYSEIYHGNRSALTITDAGVGTVGLGAKGISYLTGVEIPYVGEFVAIYGTFRLGWDVGKIMGEGNKQYLESSRNEGCNICTLPH
ncbi:MAG: hypothetical protein JKY70_11955 [Mucilaginibacter sp.]|nr:hypothetical protein [Mucilaginibacter sp.]